MTVNIEEFEKFVFQLALENALNYDGEANSKALIGKIMPKFPQIKQDMQSFMQKIENLTNQVNSMNNQEQKDKISKINPDFFKNKQEKKENNKQDKTQLIDLPNIKEKFIGRFAPAPSGYLHIGHAYNIVYNYEYKKKYGGKFILRIEDTNPENIDISNYDKMIEDVKWLTQDKIDEIFYQSDRLDIYYKYLRQLIETGAAYICECESETFKAYNDSSQACPHRNESIETQKKKYEQIFNNQYKDGEFAIRFKADLNNPNPALRDFPIARQNSTPHARVGTKYKLWPMYNLCSALDDSLMGINYIIRGKDGEINGQRQDMIKDKLNLTKSNFYHIGRIKFEDVELSKTQLSSLISNKVYTGWDDPRVPTLISFKKRGFKAEAFRKMIVADGISKRDSKITEKEYFKKINFFNKQILEKEATRYFFLTNPKEIEIKDISKYPNKEIQLPKHPEDKSRGTRTIEVKNKYFIDGIDFNNINKNDNIRLMHFANFKVIEKTNEKLIVEYISKDFDKELKINRNIHFVPREHGEHKHITIVMQDNSKLNGITEEISNPKPEENFQFERFGFVKYDSLDKEENQIYYFTQR